MFRVATEGHKTQARDKPIRGMDCPFFFSPLYVSLLGAPAQCRRSIFCRTLAAPSPRPRTSTHVAAIHSEHVREKAPRWIAELKPRD